MKTKICSKCKEEKSLNEFWKNRSKKDGLHCQCKDCMGNINNKYQEKHKEEIVKYKKKYQEKHKDVIAEKNKEYREKYKEEIAKYMKCYNKENTKKLSEYKKAWYQNNSKYNTYIYHIKWCKEARRDPNNKNLLQVMCVYCNNWFNPTNLQVQNRIAAINSVNKGSHRFYCSEECKMNCSCFRRIIHRKGENPILDYRKEVMRLTEENYDKHYSKINPNNLSRGKDYYHIDHIYSIQNGFENNIPSEIIANPNNLQMLWCIDNASKRDRSDIVVEELYELYNKFTKKEKTNGKKS